MRGTLLFVIFLLLSSISYAQLVDEVRPSVNARQFISGLSSDVCLRSGQVSASIPLFSLPGKGINVPISLVFNGEGITHESESSSVGLGWSLMAGGVITATIRGKDDNRAQKYEDIIWQFNYDHINNLWSQQLLNQYNTFGPALNNIMVGDANPDSYQYAFLGYSGDIYFQFQVSDHTKRYGTLFPNNDFKIEKTTLGYKITGNDGTEYFFESVETNVVSAENYTTSWFLSEIKTRQGGLVVFVYDNESYLDYSNPLHAGTSTNYPEVKTKRLVRITSDYGRVEFKSLYRGDMSNAKKITHIELYDNQGRLVKGYKLDNDRTFTNQDLAYPSSSSENFRLRLDAVREYNRSGEYLPPYTFDYDYYFSRSKSSYKPWTVGNMMLNSWAHNPASIALVDIDHYGDPACWIVNPNNPGTYTIGFDAISDYSDATTYDYFCLTKITHPAGGVESYTYSRHDYAGVSGCDPSFLNPNSSIRGRRVTSKQIVDGSKSVQSIEYRYRLHNDAYQETTTSSGLLIAPSIHTSVMHVPFFDSNNRSRFAATPYTTEKPQNSLSGSPVCYTEIEEVFRSVENGDILGKNIYYFDKKVALPGLNYIYVNYDFYGGKAHRLVPVYNTLYGQPFPHPENLNKVTRSNFTYIAFPVGHFSIAGDVNGKPIKEVTLDSQGRVVKKTENVYNTYPNATSYSWKIHYFNDGFEKDRYYVNVSPYQSTTCRLESSTTTHYYPSFGTSVTEEQTFGYTSGLRPLSNTVKSSNDELLETQYLYPDIITFGTQSNLSAQALSIKKLVDLNMIGTPVQTTRKRGGKFIEGTYATYKQIGSNYVAVDSLFELESQFETVLPAPKVNTSGKVERHNGFTIGKAYTAYDTFLNPASLQGRDNVPTTVKWGYGGQYAVAKIENYTHAQMEGNTTLVNLLKSLDGYTAITDANLPALLTCTQSIRNSLPEGVMITIYTYDPLAGMTSATDPQGTTVCYDYDSFGRVTQIYRVKNGVREVLESYDYHYRN